MIRMLSKCTFSVLVLLKTRLSVHVDAHTNENFPPSPSPSPCPFSLSRGTRLGDYNTTENRVAFISWYRSCRGNTDAQISHIPRAERSGRSPNWSARWISNVNAIPCRPSRNIATTSRPVAIAFLLLRSPLFPLFSQPLPHRLPSSSFYCLSFSFFPPSFCLYLYLSLRR